MGNISTHVGFDRGGNAKQQEWLENHKGYKQQARRYDGENLTGNGAHNGLEQAEFGCFVGCKVLVDTR